MKAKQLAVAIALIGAGAALNVHAEEKVNKVERVEVTGSSIKRIQKEGAAPVETISRKQIEKIGATSVNELLKSVSSMDVADQGELTSNAPSGSGQSTAKMRGQSENDMLVLLNGRRLPVNPMADGSGAGAAVDLNMIPLGAIERIEILKDGGSAIYGADASAGVINFITKKNYQGAELRAKFGISSRGDADEKSAGISGGFGDFDEQGFNVLATLDVFKREPIYRKDRDQTKSADFRSQGGPDGRNAFSPYGNIVDTEGELTGKTLKPCPANLYNAELKQCGYDFNADILTANNGADRVSGMALGRLKITDDISAYAQVFYTESKDHFEAHPIPDFFDTKEDPVTKEVTTYAGRFMQIGPRISDRKASMSQLVTGLDGLTGGVDWRAAVGRGEAKSTLSDSNYMDKNKYNAAVQDGWIDATSLNNDPAKVASLRYSPVREASNILSFADLKLSGEMPLTLPGGAVAYAVGASYTREELKDTPDALSQLGQVKGSIKQAAVEASRNAKGVFLELSLPVVKDLEVQAAVRYDSYDTASSTSPKVAVRYQPIKELLFRTSYSQSFRMPTLKQLYGAKEEGAITIRGADQCAAIGKPADCSVTAKQVSGSNKDLQPEHGESFNLGVVADVGPFSGSLDWWTNKKDDQITQPQILDALLKGDVTVVGGQRFVSTPLANVAKLENEGIDLDVRFRFPTSFATFIFSDTNTYYLKSRQKQGSGEWEQLLDMNGAPIWRNTFRVEAEAGPWSSMLALRTTSGFKDTDTRATDKNPVPAGTRDVGSHTEADLSISYTGFKDFKIDGSIKNLMDQMPPFSEVNANNHSNMGFAELYNVRGRFFSVGAQYSFK
ncbi:MAG: hypothetical protein RL571_2734 [Pseudomonadota bacterium]